MRRKPTEGGPVMSKPNARRAGAALFLATLAGCTMIAVPAAAQRGQRTVDGNNVTRVEHRDGYFAERTPGHWVQFDAAGRPIGEFSETGRDLYTVTLVNRVRLLTVVLDLRARVIMSGGFFKRLKPLYAITGADSLSGGRVDSDGRDDIPWDRNGLAQVEVGPIWSQAHADRRCRDKANEIGADWTGQWHTTVNGQMSVCEMRRRFGTGTAGGGDDSSNWDPRTGGDVEVGPIWNQADANAKCSAKAREMGVEWTGSWTSRNGTSVCGMRGRATPTPTPRPSGSPTSGVTRTFEVGPIWNQADAVSKCSARARDVQGEWTGQWWTTVPNQMSVCEIRFR